MQHQVGRVRELLHSFQHEQSWTLDAGGNHGMEDSYDSESDTKEGLDPIDIAFVIKSNVDCLMQLLPSLERTLASANRNSHIE
jgi:hypothetical protein